jgi:hypothetical protein
MAELLRMLRTGMTEFFDTGLLLGQHARARSSAVWVACRRRMGFPAQMGDVGGADHDLGRHTNRR